MTVTEYYISKSELEESRLNFINAIDQHFQEQQDWFEGKMLAEMKGDAEC